MQIEPTLVHHGLAIYRLGDGEPVMFMPGPHRFQIPGDGSAQPLIDGLLRLGRQVVSFDPPQSGHSVRRANLSMREMIECATEMLDVFGIASTVDVLGHSMGGFTALVFALERRERVRRLILVGTGAGHHAYMSMPGALASPNHPAFWNMLPRALLHMVFSCRATETSLNNYIERQSFVDRRFVKPVPVTLRDWFRSPRGRADWHRIASKLNYAPRLAEVSVPTLVLCGRYDSQFPIGASEELLNCIPNARLTVFQRSNHFPFIEEPEAFWTTLSTFLNGGNL